MKDLAQFLLANIVDSPEAIEIEEKEEENGVVTVSLKVAKEDRTNGQVYNLGGQPLTLKEFVKLAIKILGRGRYKFVRFPNDRRDIEVGNYVADIKKIKDEVGWEPMISPEEGIRATIDYFLKNKKYYW